MCDIVFQKAKGRDGKVKKRVFMQKQRSKAFFQKGVMGNFTELTRKHLCRNLFFDKVKLSGSATSLKTSL